jgi:DNA-binding transcriptional ArsR family regulator
MPDAPYIAEAAALIGDPARANMLDAMMDGRALTATELTIAAGVAPSTASGHLAKLVEGGLATLTTSGRHRYYRLASPAVARVIEDLMALAVKGPPRHRPKSRIGEDLARARTCYDHFAGRLGVAIADSLLHRDFVELSNDDAIITDRGRKFLMEKGLSPILDRASRRPFCRACLDWSERRPHLAGAVGATIAARSFDFGWAERRRDNRAVTITPAGAEAFRDLFEFEA